LTPLDSDPVTIVWFRLDLRADDHNPLVHAAKRGRVVPVYIYDPNDGLDPRRAKQIGGASKWWLHHSLISLSRRLEKIGSPLCIRVGDPVQELLQLAKEVGADQVSIHESTDPAVQLMDETLDNLLDTHGVDLIRFPSDLLWPIGSIMSGSANPYQVFTPFWKNAVGRAVQNPVHPPHALESPKILPTTNSIESLNLLSDTNWADGFRDRWNPGEQYAIESFEHFVTIGVNQYHNSRDQLDHLGCSALSAPIQFGELSIRRMWHTLTVDSEWDQNPGVVSYLRQLAWRDFSNHLLNHFPHTPDQPFRENFQKFPWTTNQSNCSKWSRGMTGYPVVDAAMRNLWAEGWMPNRARMIAASFLCKDLLISWKEGADWFWDTLIDADLANNTFGWQWSAGCGADAAPYFRIFNMVSQGKKFDPYGEYVRRWVPELANLPDSHIHNPWEASAQVLESAGISLGTDYPHPIVDHAKARISALKAFDSIKTH
jgi:deoxyribodipyrimidine photo-lyase